MNVFFVGTRIIITYFQNDYVLFNSRVADGDHRHMTQRSPPHLLQEEFRASVDRSVGRHRINWMFSTTCNLQFLAASCDFLPQDDDDDVERCLIIKSPGVGRRRWI